MRLDSRRCLAVAASAMCLSACFPAWADEAAALARAARVAGVAPAALVPDLRAVTPSPSEQLPAPVLLRQWQADPLHIPDRLRALRMGFAADAPWPAALVARAAGLDLPNPALAFDNAVAGVGLMQADPLAMVLQRLWRTAGEPWPTELALPTDLPAHRALRTAVADLLQAIVDAEDSRRRALAAVPVDVTPTLLATQLTGADPSPEHEALLRRAAAGIDRPALSGGLVRLAAATQRMARALPALAAAARVDWRWATPWGEVRIDTTGVDNTYELLDPLLVLDAGGDERYRFMSRGARNRIAVLVDVEGDDDYRAEAPGSDMSAGVLGYGIVWDTAGDDRYRGGWLAQGAAVFGGALLVDEGGRDRFDATGLAQGFAIGGLAVLASLGPGDDQYTALTHAQASAGPGGVAVLLDEAGDERYRLDPEPVVMHSSQLPDRNSSMGQGAGRGLRATPDALALPGGTGLLIDLAGDDQYQAQVFAQGAGYYFGVGALIDGSGTDHREAAWYAMGAAAHAGTGVLLDEGAGDDDYRVTHSTSIAAAHDGSLAQLRDDGGNEHYALGNLGLGAAQDASVAIFVDVAGDDHYDSSGPPCQVLGLARHSDEQPASPPGLGLGLFLDLSGRDRYPPHCAVARDGAAWSRDDGGHLIDRGAAPALVGASAGVDMEAGHAGHARD